MNHRGRDMRCNWIISFRPPNAWQECGRPANGWLGYLRCYCREHAHEPFKWQNQPLHRLQAAIAIRQLQGLYRAGAPFEKPPTRPTYPAFAEPPY